MLEQIIKDEIAAKGPMPVDRFMELALYHPEYGYYTTQMPFGVQGDFTTAPEISQIFGELVGAWAVGQWELLGRPHDFALIELGAGRGTLMRDLYNVARLRPEFLRANVHIVDISPCLTQLQREALQGSFANITWHTSVDFVRDLQMPAIFIANEFFDALPIKQFVGEDERMVVLGNDAELAFSTPCIAGKTREICLAAKEIMQTICGALSRKSGAALIIDYGYFSKSTIDSLQSVKKHNYSDPLKNIGRSDITTHVDFKQLQRCTTCAGVGDVRLSTQMDWLYGMGILLRQKTLKSGKSSAVQQQIDLAVERLTSPEQMGSLFKVMEVKKM